jgi:hypothetical protein
MLTTSLYYKIKDANNAKYTQIQQRHLNAIIQSIIPSIDNTKASKVWRRTLVAKTSKVSKRNLKID